MQKYILKWLVYVSERIRTFQLPVPEYLYMKCSIQAVSAQIKYKYVRTSLVLAGHFVLALFISYREHCH